MLHAPGKGMQGFSFPQCHIMAYWVLFQETSNDNAFFFNEKVPTFKNKANSEQQKGHASVLAHACLFNTFPSTAAQG